MPCRSPGPLWLVSQFKMGILRAYGRGQYCFNMVKWATFGAFKSRGLNGTTNIRQVRVRARSPKMDRRTWSADEHVIEATELLASGFGKPAKSVSISTGKPRVASLHPDEKDRTDTRFRSHSLAVAAALCVMLGNVVDRHSSSANKCIGRQDQHGSAGQRTAPDVALDQSNN